MIETVNIDDIRIRLFDEDQVINPYKIENTPHYKLLCGDRKDYDIYYDRMHRFGRAKNHYMNADEYLEFFPTFRYLQPPFDKEYVSVKRVGNRYESLDGDHRLASLKKLGEQNIQVDIQDHNFKHEGFSNIIDINSSKTDELKELLEEVKSKKEDLKEFEKELKKHKDKLTPGQVGES